MSVDFLTQAMMSVIWAVVAVCAFTENVACAAAPNTIVTVREPCQSLRFAKGLACRCAAIAKAIRLLPAPALPKPPAFGYGVPRETWERGRHGAG